MHQFPFRWSPLYRVLAAPFLVRPGNATVVVGSGRLTIRFGRWTLDTGLDNVIGVNETSNYSLLKTAGPPHLSLSDGGITFATNGQRGLCLRFGTPVAAIEPTGRLRHPAATVTVDDVDGLRGALTEAGA